MIRSNSKLDTFRMILSVCFLCLCSSLFVCVCVCVIPTNLTFKKMIIRMQVAISIYRVVCKVNTYTEQLLYICLCTYICHIYIYIYIVCISYIYRMCYQQLQLAARKKITSFDLGIIHVQVFVCLCVY